MAQIRGVAGAVRLAAGLLLAACSSDATGPPAARSPAAARFVTEDIDRFWLAFDKLGETADSMPFRRDYLDPGTVGLADFTARRWKNARTLTNMVHPRRQYYASIRTNTRQIAMLEPAMRQIYERMAELYPAADFPNVYFVIGGMSTGGTTSPSGLLIGAELFSRSPNSPVHELTPWQQMVAKSSETLPAVVAHELVHFQQTGGGSSLLAQSIKEGSADFIGELISGLNLGADRKAYGDAHEAALWREFSAVMNGSDVSQWLYNGGSVTGPESRPADLGYYIGSRIAEAYYERTPDKAKAIRDILLVTNAAQFLAQSGYAERFPN